MTSKAGQKCTAIRRAIVPAASVDALIDAVRARIEERVVVGDPRAEGVTMGPLASTAQRDDVLAQVAKLDAAGGEVVIGSTDAPVVTRADGSAAPRPAARSSPRSCCDSRMPRPPRARDRGVRTGHLGASGYDDSPTRAWSPAAADRSSRVCTHDPDVAPLVAGISPWHGRVLVLDGAVARTSTGHGSPVPHLVHGGPGRAGGGAELGGIRSVLHYMRRTALQGSPRCSPQSPGSGTPARRESERAASVPQVAGRAAHRRPGHLGAARRHARRHRDFAEFTGDTFYAHMDEEAAAANPFFPVASRTATCWCRGRRGCSSTRPGPGAGQLRAGEPAVHHAGLARRPDPGDLTAKQITPRETEEYGEVRWDAVLVNQSDEVVATYDVLTLVAKESCPRPGDSAGCRRRSGDPGRVARASRALRRVRDRQAKRGGASRDRHARQAVRATERPRAEASRS